MYTVFKHMDVLGYFLKGIKVHWGSEYQTSLVFKCSILEKPKHLITGPFIYSPCEEDCIESRYFVQAVCHCPEFEWPFPFLTGN
jgi:hypothetical protein